VTIWFGVYLDLEPISERYSTLTVVSDQTARTGAARSLGLRVVHATGDQSQDLRARIVLDRRELLADLVEYTAYGSWDLETPSAQSRIRRGGGGRPPHRIPMTWGHHHSGVSSRPLPESTPCSRYRASEGLILQALVASCGKLAGLGLRAEAGGEFISFLGLKKW
jgi:hypothetical protein